MPEAFYPGAVVRAESDAAVQLTKAAGLLTNPLDAECLLENAFDGGQPRRGLPPTRLLFEPASPASHRSPATERSHPDWACRASRAAGYPHRSGFVFSAGVDGGPSVAGWPWHRWWSGRGLPSGADVVITGLPRSGTSYFCAALHNVRNCVAINEPEEIFAHLSDTSPPWGMPLYYAELRREILAGRPIVNKIRDGRFIEDTAEGINEERYVPAVSGPGFLLATKNTLAYLARLPLLEQSMPGVTCVACIRNPVDTVASWKGTFDHLSAAAVRNFRAGCVGDERLSPAARDRVGEIDLEPRLERRRALLWRHLALLVEEAGGFVRPVIRYEQLVTDPERTLRDLLASIPAAPPPVPVEPFVPSAVRTQRVSSLTADDLAAIHDVCADVAARFGYDLACSS